MKLILFLLLPTLSWAMIPVDEGRVDKLIDNNPNLLNFAARYEAAQKLKGSLLRSFLPKVNLTYGQEKFTTGPYDGVVQPFGGIEASVNVFNYGKDFLENNKRNKEAQIAMIDSKVTESLIKAEVKKSLSHYAYLKEIEVILKDALKLNEQNILGAKKRVNAGLATQTDILDFKQQKIQLNQELASLYYEQGVVERLVATLIGEDPKTELSINFVNSHPEHGPEVYQLPTSNNSLLTKKLSLLSEVAALDQKKSSLWWSPTIDVYGYALRFTEKEREYPTTGQRNDFTLGIKLTFPIFDGGEGYQAAKSQKANARGVVYQFKQKTLEVERDTQDALKKLSLAHTLIHGSEDSVSVMTQYREGIIKEYNRGIKNSPDVLQANERWIEARTRFAEVKKNYQFAKVDATYLKSLSR